MVKNQEVNKREQRTLGDCWQWKANGQCSKGDNCSFRNDILSVENDTVESVSEFFHAAGMRDMRREPEVPEEEVPVVECLDGPARITLKELAPIHSVKNGTLQNACSTGPRVVCRFGQKCSYAHCQVDEQPSERSKKNDDKSAVAMLKSTRQLGCVFPGYGAARS